MDFGGFNRVNPLVQFYAHVNVLLKEESIALDVGCGRGGWLESGVDYIIRLPNLKGKCAKVIGIDVSESGTQNESLDEFRFIDQDQGHWPVDTASVDALVADCVVEHLADPSAFFNECMRVLKPNGVGCLRTFNVLHYNGCISRFIPNRLHTKVLKVAQPHRREEDIFPTYYRSNTPGRLRKQLGRAGFEACTYCHEGQPAYLSFSSVAYRLGVFYQRHAWDVFKWNLFAFARKLSS